MSLNPNFSSHQCSSSTGTLLTKSMIRWHVGGSVTLYWLTNTAISSARLYWDTAQIPARGGFLDVRGVKIPVAVSAFLDEIYTAPKSWAEKAYPKLIYYNKLPKGGHFAAWEQPEVFVKESEGRLNRCVTKKEKP